MPLDVSSIYVESNSRAVAVLYYGPPFASEIIVSTKYRLFR